MWLVFGSVLKLSFLGLWPCLQQFDIDSLDIQYNKLNLTLLRTQATTLDVYFSYPTLHSEAPTFSHLGLKMYGKSFCSTPKVFRNL